jgi:geranylgeranyl diphosphate synthase type II
MDLNQYREIWVPRIDSCLANEILGFISKEAKCTRKLTEAIKYAVLGGGKRLRPLLVLAAIRAVGEDEEIGLSASCALELIHAYSLVHDDLPAMDDDDFRRGQPSCHKKYGEALAILAGDALLTHAFYVLAEAVPATLVGEAVRLVSRAAGPLGMVGGQADDIQISKPEITIADVDRVHLQKTGALFEAAVLLGGLLVRAGDIQKQSLSRYAKNLGLAFQIADDLLAKAGDQKTLGRPTDSDEIKERRTYPSIVGIVESRKRAEQLLTDAKKAITELSGQVDILNNLIGLVAERLNS